MMKSKMGCFGLCWVCEIEGDGDKIKRKSWSIVFFFFFWEGEGDRRNFFYYRVLVLVLEEVLGGEIGINFFFFFLNVENI